MARVRAGAPLRLLGGAGATDETSAVKRRLDDAGMLVGEFAGVLTDSIVVEGGPDGILAAAPGARLLVVGLSERRRDEGLGETRSQFARSSAAPILFVRRGKPAPSPHAKTSPASAGPPQDSPAAELQATAAASPARKCSTKSVETSPARKRSSASTRR